MASEKTQWPALSWVPEARAESLKAVAKHVGAEGEAVTRWYLDNKETNHTWTRLLRGLDLLLILVAAIVPPPAEMWTNNGTFALSPAWASMALVLAAGCVGFDRFFGFSSAWMRFITIELFVRNVLRAFQPDWETHRAGWHAEPPDTGARLQALDACKACLVRLDALVLEETERWVQEFSAAIEEIDKSAKAAQAHEQRGAVLTVTVRNGDSVTASWTLSLDDGPPECHHGRTAARADLFPGAHRLVQHGDNGGQPKTRPTRVHGSPRRHDRPRDDPHLRPTPGGSWPASPARPVEELLGTTVGTPKAARPRARPGESARKGANLRLAGT